MAAPVKRRAGQVYALGVTYRDDTLETRVRRGFGFRVECECGEQSPRCASVSMARGWLREHRSACGFMAHRGASLDNRQRNGRGTHGEAIA